MEQACLECETTDPTGTRTFKLHLKRVHGLKLKDYVIKHLHGGVHPTCECGCGGLVAWRNDAYFQRLIKGHVTQEMRRIQGQRRKGVPTSIETRSRQSASSRLFWSSGEGRKLAEERAEKLRKFHASEAGRQWSLAQSRRMKEFNATDEGKRIRGEVANRLKHLHKDRPELWPVSRKVRITVTCLICDDPLEIIPKTKRSRSYCSRACASVARVQSRFEKSCVGCGTMMSLTLRNLRVRRFCSTPCARSSVPTRERLSVKMIEQHMNGHRDHGNLRHESGFFDGEKTSKPAWYRSSYELAYLRYLESSDDVQSYEVEPFSIPYVFEGATLHYVPDVLVMRCDGSRDLVEVKPAALLNLGKNVAKRKAAQDWCVVNDARYFEVTEQFLDSCSGASGGIR